MLEKLEIKINKLKKKVNKKYLGVFLFMLFGAMSIFAMEMLNNFKRQKDMTQNFYTKAMYETVGYIKNVELELTKLKLATTPKYTTTTLATIWRETNLAKENIESLPTAQNVLSKVANYLAQVSDISYSLMKTVASGNTLTQKDYENVNYIQENSVELSKIIQNIYEELNSGKIKWDEVEKLTNEKLNNLDISIEVSNFGKLEKAFQEYEGLIYDGAYSNHILNIKPKWLSDKEITNEEGIEKIKEYFKKENIENIEFKREINGNLNLYKYEVKLKNIEDKKQIELTKNDGRIYLMISDRKVLNQNIDIDEAKRKAIEFLNNMGIYDIKDTYYGILDNMITINFAGYENNIVMYTDLIKVKVALDNGEIMCVESQGYIFNKRQREKEELISLISIDEAKDKLNKNLDIKASNLAIIPTDSKGEILTYEFIGIIDEKEYLIYINAKTGEEENILLVVDNKNGKLTM